MFSLYIYYARAFCILFSPYTSSYIYLTHECDASPNDAKFVCAREVFWKFYRFCPWGYKLSIYNLLVLVPEYYSGVITTAYQI